MKVSKIEEINGVFNVTLVPNLLESLFGIKEKVSRFRTDGTTFVFGGGTSYIREDGETTGNGSYIGEAIDKWRRRF